MALSAPKAFVYNEESYIASFDPRAKLALGLVAIVASLTIYSPEKALVLMAFMLLLAAASRNLSRVSYSLLFALPFLLIIAGGEMLISRSIYISLGYAMRFANLVLAGSTSFTSISPDEFEFVVRWLGAKGDFAFLLSATFRFIPLLALDLEQIVQVQKARGVDFSTRNIAKWIANMASVLVPLMVVSIVRSGEMAEAMELRGYGVRERTKPPFKFRFRARDAALVLTVIAFYVALMFVKV